MESKFIVVFDPQVKNDLIKQGYLLLKEDLKQGVAFFANNTYSTLNFDKSQLILTDTLTF